jgi:4-hydroxy-2-oxoheptanedioate aldolase
MLLMIVSNRARERLATGELAIGVGVRLARTIEIGKLMRGCGYDWLLIDLEHGTISLDAAAQISIAALDAGIAPIVRVPQDEYAMAARAIDGGALGIIMPHVDTAEQAADTVRHLKYPPLGHLSAGGAMPQSGFKAVRGADAAASMNETVLLSVMLETPTAIANADAIAAVPGIDIVMIGTNDLMMEMGIDGNPDHADISKAYEAMIAACDRHRKWAGMGGVHRDESMARYMRMGARFILTTSDLALLVAHATHRENMIRGFK